MDRAAQPPLILTVEPTQEITLTTIDPTSTYTPTPTETTIPTPTYTVEPTPAEVKIVEAFEIASNLSWIYETKFAPGVEVIYKYSEDGKYLVEYLNEGEITVGYLVAKKSGSEWERTSLDEKYSEFPPIYPGEPYQYTDRYEWGETYFFSADPRWKSHRITPYWTGKYIEQNWTDPEHGTINVIAAQMVMRDLIGEPVELNLRIGSGDFVQSGLVAVQYMKDGGGYIAESLRDKSPLEVLDFINLGEQVATALTYSFPENIKLPLNNCRPEHKYWCKTEYVSNYHMFEENKDRIFDLVDDLINGTDINFVPNIITPSIKSFTIIKYDY